MRYHKETVAISPAQTAQTGDLENSGFSATQRRTGTKRVVRERHIHIFKLAM